jgi:GTP:adenosylcobinamide-phosphate guanylyltransferase
MIFVSQLLSVMGSIMITYVLSSVLHILDICTFLNINKRLKNTERAIKNGQSRESVNIWYTRGRQTKVEAQ